MQWVYTKYYRHGMKMLRYLFILIVYSMHIVLLAHIYQTLFSATIHHKLECYKNSELDGGGSLGN